MSGILGGLLLLWPLWIWLGWAFCTWLVYLVWRMFRPLDNKRIFAQIIFGVVLFGPWLGWSLWELGLKKVYWDTQVNRLCAVDGGATVYEAVELPPDKFDERGKINFFKPDRGQDALGSDYEYENDVETTHVDDNVTILRIQHTIIRRSDNKLLGRKVSYARRGGDIVEIGHPSSYGCPEYRNGDILEKVFVKSKITGGE